MLSFSVLFTCTLKAQNTKLVHASTTASSLSAMLKKHSSTKPNVSSQDDSTRSTKSNVSSRVESSQVEFGPTSISGGWGVNRHTVRHTVILQVRLVPGWGYRIGYQICPRKVARAALYFFLLFTWWCLLLYACNIYIYVCISKFTTVYPYTYTIHMYLLWVFRKHNSLS